MKYPVWRILLSVGEYVVEYDEEEAEFEPFIVKEGEVNIGKLSIEFTQLEKAVMVGEPPITEVARKTLEGLREELHKMLIDLVDKVITESYQLALAKGEKGTKRL